VCSRPVKRIVSMVFESHITGMEWEGGTRRTPPMTPRPPAFVTAAASFGPAATFIPASMTGCLILRRSVTVVLICCGEDILAMFVQ